MTIYANASKCFGLKIEEDINSHPYYSFVM